LSGRIEIRRQDFHKSHLRHATIVYNGLMEEDGDLSDYEKKLTRGCRLVTISLPLVGVMPYAYDYPFYLMKIPFRKTRSASEWISTILPKKKATMVEFFEEVHNDPEGYRQDMRTLKSLMKTRFGVRTFL